MSDRNRLIFAGCLSLALNASLLMLPWGNFAEGHAPPRNPLMLNLRPEPPEPPPAPPPPPDTRPVQAVESARPAEQPVETTNLRSDVNTNAADLTAHDGERPGPALEEDTLASLPIPAGAASSAAAPERPPGKETKPAPEPEEPGSVPAPAVAADDAPEGDEVEESSASPAPAEATQVARATPPGAEYPQPARGPAGGRSMEEDYIGFEAIQDDVAAYFLKHVKPVIRRNWITNLLTRYTGTTRTKAMIALAIAPDGHIAKAEVMGAPDDRIFAALCRDAVQKSGPFPPFLFQIPPEYRDQNLVIHCRFQWQ